MLLHFAQIWPFCDWFPSLCDVLRSYTHAYTTHASMLPRLQQLPCLARPDPLLHMHRYRLIPPNASKTSWKRYTRRWLLRQSYRCHYSHTLLRYVVCFPRHRRPPRSVTGRRYVPQLTNRVFASMQTQALETSLSGVLVNVEVDQNYSAVPATSDPILPGPEGQIEIPFVPAHKRQTLSNPQNYEIKDDTIVVVGQAGARQRKRRRDKARGIPPTSQLKSGTRLGGAETSAFTADHDREAEEFDYSSIPNLLDDESKHGGALVVHEEDERRTKKQRHAKGMLTSSPDQCFWGKCEHHTLCFLRGIRFVFNLARDKICYPSTCSWCYGRQSIGESLFLLSIPRLPVAEIYSRI